MSQLAELFVMATDVAMDPTPPYENRLRCLDDDAYYEDAYFEWDRWQVVEVMLLDELRPVDG